MKPTRGLVWALALVCALLQGCAAPAGLANDARDPWEASNRRIYDFNEQIDNAVLRPVAQVWADRVPELVRKIGRAHV